MELGQRGVAPSGVEWRGVECSGNGSSQQQTDDLMRTADFCRAKHLIVSQRAHSARSLARNGVEGGMGKGAGRRVSSHQQLRERVESRSLGKVFKVVNRMKKLMVYMFFNCCNPLN